MSAPTLKASGRRSAYRRALVAALKAAPQPIRNGPQRPPTWASADDYDRWRDAFDACEMAERGGV